MARRKRNSNKPPFLDKSTEVAGAAAGEQAPRSAAVQTWLAVSGVGMLFAMLWAYWPTLSAMVDTWERQPDYSHGYLVLPLSLFFLWTRRSTFPWNSVRPSWGGAALLIGAATLRGLAGLYYLLPLDGWTLPLTIAGAVWLLWGGAVLKWSFSAIIFLYFMVPMPFSVERLFSVPLQALATKVSTVFLVMLGQPAIAEGNTIALGEHMLFIEEACSGLRIFIGILALAFAFVLFSRWAWWQKVLVLMAALPAAVFANVTRIVVTGLLYKGVSSEAGQKFSHDIAGFVMIPFAAVIFWLFLNYLDRLFPVVEEIRPSAELFRPGEPAM